MDVGIFRALLQFSYYVCLNISYNCKSNCKSFVFYLWAIRVEIDLYPQQNSWKRSRKKRRQWWFNDETVVYNQVSKSGMNNQVSKIWKSMGSPIGKGGGGTL